MLELESKTQVYGIVDVIKVSSDLTSCDIDIEISSHRVATGETPEANK